MKKLSNTVAQLKKASYKKSVYNTKKGDYLKIFIRSIFEILSNIYDGISENKYPVDTGRKLNVHKTSRTSSERLMYVQFTSCVYRDG